MKILIVATALLISVAAPASAELLKPAP